MKFVFEDSFLSQFQIYVFSNGDRQQQALEIGKCAFESLFCECQSNVAGIKQSLAIKQA